MLSVIIPTYNRNEQLSTCLAQLAPSKQTIGDVYEVIVTDDSKEAAVEKLIQTTYPWVKYVKGPGKGPAANRNNGAKYAEGEWLVFIDDDCVPDKDVLKAYSNAINYHKTTEVFEGYISVDRSKKSFNEESPINETGGFLWSCNFMISANLFEKINGFDINFPYAAMEDVDLLYRIKNLDKEVEFISHARVIHPWRVEKNVISKAKKHFQSTLYFLKKHPDATNKLNAKYYFKIFVIHLKAILIYGHKFKYRGVNKQIAVSFLHLYFSFIIFLRNIHTINKVQKM